MTSAGMTKFYNEKILDKRNNIYDDVAKNSTIHPYRKIIIDNFIFNI